MALGFWYVIIILNYERRLIKPRYGGRLISFGEYTVTQFFTVFIGVIFSGEAAASFFQYTTSLTKSATAANYVFWLRRLKPAVQEDPSKPPFDHDTGRGPAHVEVQDVAFAYESRPNTKVLEGIDVDVSVHILYVFTAKLTYFQRYGPASSSLSSALVVSDTCVLLATYTNFAVQDAGSPR